MENNLSAYRAFYETALEGNISRAAGKIGVTQPAISKSITKLEQSFGVKLFSRTQRGVSLTPEGDVLYEHLKQAFYNIDQGEEELWHLRDYEYGRLKIGSSAALCKFFLLSYLKDFFDKYQFVKLSVEDASTSATLNRIINHKLDVGAVMFDKKDPDVVFEKVMDVEDIFVCTPLYMKRLEELYGKNPDVFDKANIMLLDREHVTRRYIDDYLRSEGINPKRLLEFPTMELLIDMAKINIGVSSVIREFVSMELKEGILIEIPLRKRIPRRKAGFAYLESNNNPALKQFLESIR